MKLFVSSDWHVDHVTNGVHRFSEIMRAVDQIAQMAIEERSRGATVGFMFLGDLCDPDNGKDVAVASKVVVGVASKLAAKDVSSFWLVGNHDVVEDGSGVTTLDALADFGSPLVTLAKMPGVYSFCGKRVLALPFTATSHRYTPSELVDRSADLVVGHLTIPGMHPGEETTEMPRGRDVLFPIDETDGMFRMNGHYHCRQSFFPKGAVSPIEIPGSLARLTFGEEAQHKSFLVLEI